MVNTLTLASWEVCLRCLAVQIQMGSVASQEIWVRAQLCLVLFQQIQSTLTSKGRKELLLAPGYKDHNQGVGLGLLECLIELT